MKTVLHRADTRGYFDHGWLRTHHTFSFAEYHNPQRIHFGALRVLNDDSIAPATGFDTHSHRNMEIISIPLKGELKHQDSMGNSTFLKEGEIQVMTAGSGITHSEYNASKDNPAELLQIWIMPEQMNLTPHYENAFINPLLVPNEISEIVSPHPGYGKSLRIHQQAWFSMGDLTKGTFHTYQFKSSHSVGVYLFIIKGTASIEDTELHSRDGIGIYDTNTFNLNIKEDSRILLIEVPRAPENN